MNDKAEGSHGNGQGRPDPNLSLKGKEEQRRKIEIEAIANRGPRSHSRNPAATIGVARPL
jgi:hypothetical protein